MTNRQLRHDLGISSCHRLFIHRTSKTTGFGRLAWKYRCIFVRDLALCFDARPRAAASPSPKSHFLMPRYPRSSDSPLAHFAKQERCNLSLCRPFGRLQNVLLFVGQIHCSSPRGRSSAVSLLKNLWSGAMPQLYTLPPLEITTPGELLFCIRLSSRRLSMVYANQ